MTNRIATIADWREALTGEHAGNKAGVAVVIRDALTGERIGRLAPFLSASQSTDALVGYSVGSLLTVDRVTSEALSGDSIGIDKKPAFIMTVRETLGRDSSYKLISVVREALVFSNEPISIAWETRNLSMLSVAHRVTDRPSVVKSMEQFKTLCQLVVRKVARLKASGPDQAWALRQMAVQHRATLAPSNMPGPAEYKALRQLVVRSRSKVLPPSSGVYVKNDKQLVVQHRVTPPPSTAVSASRVNSLVQLVVTSLRFAYRQDVKQVVQLVVRQRIKTFAPTQAWTLTQQIVQQRPAVTVRSEIDVVSLATMVARHRWVPATQESELAVGSYSMLALQQRAAAPIWLSMTEVAGAQQQVVQQRDLIKYWSDIMVVNFRELVVQERIPVPYYSQPEVAGEQQLVVQHREVSAPNQTSDWNAKTLIQKIVQHRTTFTHPISDIDVAVVSTSVVLASVYPLPGDVMGPEVGAQFKTLIEMVLLHRETESPGDVLTRSRFVFQVAGQVAVGDVFPDPAAASSEITAGQVAEGVVLVDVFGLPNQASSDAIAGQVAEALVQGDVFGNPVVAQSEAQVIALAQGLVQGDTFTDPGVATSTATSGMVGQLAALGDDSFPNPADPVSDARSFVVGALVAAGDHSFPSPTAPTSEIQVKLLTSALVLRDLSMQGLPKRLDRRRPVVSLSVS